MDAKAKEGIEKHQQIIKRHFEDAGTAPTAAAQTYEYDCHVSLAGIGAGYVAVNFSKDGRQVAQFQGGFAPGVGGYTGWGRAWFNVPVEGLIGQTAGCGVEVVGVFGGTAHVQITDADKFIGNCSTGGVGIGAGVGSGAGKFVAG
jgi:hypothetical protein